MFATQTMMIISVVALFVIFICCIVICLAIWKNYCLQVEQEQFDRRRRNVDPNREFDFNQL